MVTSEHLYGAGARIMKGVNVDKLVGKTTRVEDWIVYIVLHNTNVNDNNVSVVT